MGLVKQLTVPSWQTRPSPSTSTRKSRASLSQSVAAEMMRRRLPLVSPFIQSFWRVRLQKVTKPVSSVLRVAGLVEEAEHQHLAGVGVLHDAGDQAVHLGEVDRRVRSSAAFISFSFRSVGRSRCRAQQKGPLAVCASAGLSNPVCAFCYFAAPDTAANTLCAW